MFLSFQHIKVFIVFHCWLHYFPTQVTVSNNFSILKKKYFSILQSSSLTLSRRSFAVWISSSPSWMTNLPSDHSVAIWKQNDMININSLASRRHGSNFKIAIFEHTDSAYERFLRNYSENIFYDMSTLARVMAWCRQATSHYQNQCLPWSILPYGVIRPQWV